MYQAEYYIDKTSNTFADNLEAFGLAFVLNNIVDGRGKIRIEDLGSIFKISCDPGIKTEWVENSKFFVGAPFLKTFDKKTQQTIIKGCSISPEELLENGLSIVDYEAEKQINQEYFNWIKQLSPDEKRKVRTGELIGPSAPHSNWEIFRAINPSALQSYNAAIAEWWHGHNAFPKMLKVLLSMVASTPNPVGEAEKAWIDLCKLNQWKSPKKASISQLLNPTQGKGGNNAKSEWKDPENLKGFWMLEWLKWVGFFNGAITHIVSNPKDPRNAKDRKIYVLMPVSLEWGIHQNIMQEFRKAMVRSATAVKMDIFASLQYTLAFLKHFEKARTEDLNTELFGNSPTDLIGGMQTGFYKNLGNAVVIMNIAGINLPKWVIWQNPENLAQLQNSLNEHINIIRNLDETRGEQFKLLTCYRDFLSGNDLDPFFEFTTAYSGFIIGQIGRGKYVPQFSTSTLEVLFMNSENPNQPYSQILFNDGFKNVAYAIRHSTIIPQYQKAHGIKVAVNIRYGLGQQLSRKSTYPADFLSELTEFILLYNAENAQLSEKGRKPFRKNITTSDIDAITDLVDRFGSKLICNMLVAYGYASIQKENNKQGNENDEEDLNSAEGNESSVSDEEISEIDEE